MDDHAKLAKIRIPDNKLIRTDMLISLLEHSPVTAHPKDYPDGAHQPLHRHPEAQLLYAVTGLMRLVTANGAWVIPPTRGVWIAPMIEHEIFMSGEVRMRSLFIAAEHCPANLDNCCVLAITPLLRELILRATQNAQHAAKPLIQQLMLEEIATLENLPLHIPIPATGACKPSARRCSKHRTTATPWKTGRSKSVPAHAPWRGCSIRKWT